MLFITWDGIRDEEFSEQHRKQTNLSGVRLPVTSGVISPQLPKYFWPLIEVVNNSMFLTIVGGLPGYRSYGFTEWVSTLKLSFLMEEMDH